MTTTHFKVLFSAKASRFGVINRNPRYAIGSLARRDYFQVAMVAGTRMKHSFVNLRSNEFEFRVSLLLFLILPSSADAALSCAPQTNRFALESLGSSVPLSPSGFLASDELDEALATVYFHCRLADVVAGSARTSRTMTR